MKTMLMTLTGLLLAGTASAAAVGGSPAASAPSVSRVSVDAPLAVALEAERILPAGRSSDGRSASISVPYLREDERA